MSKKSSLITLCSSGLAVTSAQAALVTNNFADVSLELSGVNQIFFDFETLSYSTTNFIGADYRIFKSDNGGLNDFIINPFNGGYYVVGGEFVTNGAYGGGEYTYGSGTRQPIVRAFGIGDKVGGGEGLLNSGSFVLTASNEGGVKYDFSSPSAIGLVRQVSPGNYEYGYINVEKGSLVLKSAARETVVNQDITVVPEPSSLALLSLGVLGIAGYRKRQA